MDFILPEDIANQVISDITTAWQILLHLCDTLGRSTEDLYYNALVYKNSGFSEIEAVRAVYMDILAGR